MRRSIVVDSSGWIEFLVGDANAQEFRAGITGESPPIVPTIVLFEVAKYFARNSPERASAALGYMQTGDVVDLDAALAQEASALSIGFGLAMADSIILATAHRFDATVWTQDKDFEGLAGVRYFPKPLN